MRQAQTQIDIATAGRGLYEFTRQAGAFLRDSGLQLGVMTLFCRHTSASLLIQENADPTVCEDLETFFARLAPEGRELYAHDLEGPDDMPAHLRAALTQTSLNIPFAKGQLLLGSWQGIYLFEHRRAAHVRQAILHVIGE